MEVVQIGVVALWRTDIFWPVMRECLLPEVQRYVEVVSFLRL
jgi:hypothetical protein